MECSACGLPVRRGEPKMFVGDELIHASCDLDGAVSACVECWLVHAPAQKGCC